MKGRMLIGISVLALLTALTVGLGQAQGPAPDNQLQPGRTAGPAGAADAAPPQAGVAIPYAGRLTGDAGQPVADGAYDFAFALYASQAGGEPFWSEVQSGVLVEGGAFSASLGSAAPIPPAVLDRQALWLAVGVRGPGEAAFTALNPRQQVSPAAPDGVAASAACPHDHFREIWLGSASEQALWIYNQGNGHGLQVTTEGAGASGVLVYQPAGIGVQVFDAATYGVYSFSNSAAHYGGYFFNSAEDGAGLYASGGSNTAPDLVLGVYGAGDDGRIYSLRSETSSDILLFSNDEVHVHLDEDNNSSSEFIIYNGDNTAVWSVGEKGEVTFGVEAGAYGPRAAYPVRATGDWIEDFGTAELLDGQATVAIEPVFAQMVSLVEYQVFLTPLGDCPLYVAAKTPASFTVKAIGGQKCAIPFDYRLVAKRLGNEQARLEPVDATGEERED